MIWAIILAGLVFIPALVIVFFDRSKKKSYIIQAITCNDSLVYGGECTVNIYYDDTDTTIYIQSHDLRFRDSYDVLSSPVFTEGNVVMQDKNMNITIDTNLEILIVRKF